MRLAIFDFDGTLYPNETMTYLLHQWKIQKYPKHKLFKAYTKLLPLYIKYKSGVSYGMSKQEMREMAVIKFNHIFYGMSEEMIEKYFFDSFINMKDTLNKAVVKEVDQARKNGYHTVILSGAYKPFLNHIGDDLGIDTIIGTEIFFKDGVFDSSRGPEIVTGANKINRINHHFNSQIDWDNSIAYADSIFDLPLLEAVGQPIIVNPDYELRALGNERKWRMLQ